MKKLTTGVFPSRERAEEAINALQNDLGVPTEDISYIYRNTEGEVREVQVDENADTAEVAAEGAAGGAVTGGALGAIAGIATAAGVIPVIGPIFAGGALLSALGIGLAGAAGATAAAATTGVIAGGLVGALASLGVPETEAKVYEDRVAGGDILVAVHSSDTYDVADTLNAHGALSVESYTPSI